MKSAFSKSILIIFVLGLTLTSCMQEAFNNKKISGNKKVVTETRTLRSDFTKLEKSGSIDVVLTKGKQDGKLELKGESNLLEYIETKVEGSSLMIHTKKGFNLNSKKPLQVTLKAEDINTIMAAGSGDVKTEGKATLKTKKFKIDRAGSGDVELNLSVKNLIINSTGSGDITLSGKANDLKINKNGSGDIYAYDLKVKNASVNSSGSGDSELKVKKNLEVSKTGSGDIHYKGQPELKASTTGSGKIVDEN